MGKMSENMQIRELIKARKSAKRYKVYFRVEIYNKAMDEVIFESFDLTYAKASKLFAEILASKQHINAVKQLVRYQSYGREIIQNVTC